MTFAPTKRRIAAMLLGCLITCGAAHGATMRIVVPFSAGGTLDAMARMIARRLGEALQEPVIVENRPGADTAIGTRLVVKSAADGKTLLLAASAIASMVSTHRLDYDPLRDLKPVIQLTASENLLAANAQLELRSLAGLARLARIRSQGLNCAGIPGQMALGCDHLGKILDGRVVTVPFQSMMPALNAMLAGHVDIMFVPRAAAGPLARDGRLTVLASAAETRSQPPFERLPLLKETWPLIKMHSYAGLYVPAGTPSEVVARLNRELNTILSAPETRDYLDGLGYTVVGGSPEVLFHQVADDIEYYRRLVRDLAGPVPGGQP
jgi:tripartite-type tricarboxylate transporter receptor subunit TctC